MSGSNKGGYESTRDLIEELGKRSLFREWGWRQIQKGDWENRVSGKALRNHTVNFLPKTTVVHIILDIHTHI
jgi:hypothetical protein